VDAGMHLGGGVWYVGCWEVWRNVKGREGGGVNSMRGWFW
jgi:hypothetical protein